MRTIEEQYKDILERTRQVDRAWAPINLTFGERLSILLIQADTLRRAAREER